jgi:WD40 repeat protein
VQGEAGVTEIWHFARGVRVFSEQTRADAFAFHPDGRLFFYAPVQTGLAVWDLEARREVRRLPLDSRVPNTLLIDQENSRLVVNDLHERAIRLIDVETGRERERWTDSVGRNTMSLSSDGRLLAAGDWNGSVFVWDMKRHALASTLTGHTNYVGHCQFAPWSHVLATSSWDGTLRFWDASLGRPLFDIKMANFLAFAPDGNGVALVVGDRKLTMGTIVHSETYQALNPEMIGNGSKEQVEGGQVRCAQFSPDGQLLAIGLNDGVHLYQAKSGNHIGLLQSGPCESVLFEHEGKAVISGGPWGYYRWPIRRSGPDSQTKDARPEALGIGPPELLTALSLSAEMAGAQWLPDHKTLAVIDNPAAQVRLIDTSQPHPARKPYDCLFSARNHRLTTIAISPDGKWAACGGWKEWGITLWDLPARRLDRILNANDVPGSSICFVGFSPNGKKMVSSSMSAVIGYSAWEVGTWKNAPLLSEQSFGAHRAPVFTADGTVIGLCASQTQVRLLDAATGRALVNLLNPLSLSSTPIAFSPDGAQMIAGTNTKTALLWNLKRVRGWLRTLNLDWDGGPQYPATPEPVVARLEAQVVGQVMEPDARQKMDLAEASVRLLVNPDDSDALMMRGAALAARGRDAEAIKDFARYHRLNPENKTPDQHFAFVLNRHARSRVNLKPEDSAPRETAGLARMAVAIAPNAPDYLNTLGIALCRAGQDADALQYLNKSLDLGAGVCDAQNLYFLAIAHHRLGHVQTAKRYLKRAIDWHTSHKLSTKISPSELDRFRAEAQSVLATPPAIAQAKDVLAVRCMF